MQQVGLTTVGERLFLRLRRAASSFDGRLRAGLGPDDVTTLRRLLDSWSRTPSGLSNPLTDATFGYTL